VIGAIVAWISSRNISANWEGRGAAAAVFGGFVLYQVRWVRDFTQILPLWMGETSIWLVSAMGCGLIVFGVMHNNRIKRFLHYPILVHLGRISYSLYLVQMVVLICISPWIMMAIRWVGFSKTIVLQILILIVVSTITMIFAHFGERWIECPAIALGRRLTKRIDDSAFFSRFRI
jgi:peptidoglycan/LPS O-acetylase OafA/YrhL